MAVVKKLNKADKTKLLANTKRKGDLRRALAYVPSYNILAIDPATNCGWAMSKDEFGLWNFKQKIGTSQGFKWLQFEEKLKKFIDENDIKVMATELPAIRGHAVAIIHHSKLNGIMEKVCAEKGVEYISFPATEIKKFATGKGTAKKEEMISMAKELLGYEGENDNEADALWILTIAKHNLINNLK